jgi:UDPglucose--hexose-1-phosphate uridylyltransferase
VKEKNQKEASKSNEVFVVSEIRKHYFLSEYCIIAEERTERPSDFADTPESFVKHSSGSCSFCEGSEESTPLATAVYKNEKIFNDTLEERIRNWNFRCFPNRYPALSRVPHPLEHQEIGLQVEPGYGFHEVIVETPLHGRRIEDFSDLELSGLMNVYRDRTCNYMVQEKIRYVSLFKNIGKIAGASINHSHSQLIALPFCPPSLEKEIKVIKERDNCPYCEIVNREKKAYSRLIFESNECIAFAPYFSIGPFEVWILPKRHVSFLGDCNDKLLSALGKMLQDVLISYGKVSKNLPLNYMFYQLFENPGYHLNLRFLPKLSINAGFELNTGTYINTVSPERAASYLKGDIIARK